MMMFRKGRHRHETRIVGITGGIGAGKSVVCRILTLRGYQVYDCDSRAKELMQLQPMAAVIAEIVGSKAFNPDGTLDRRYLAFRIFADEALRLRVNEVVHEGVRNDIRKVASECGGEILFVESAILATSNLHGMTSEIWLVDAPAGVRVARILSRDPLASVDDAMRRIEAQNAECGLLKGCDVRGIDNSGTVPLLPQIDQRLKALKIRKYKQKYKI